MRGILLGLALTALVPLPGRAEEVDRPAETSAEQFAALQRSHDEAEKAWAERFQEKPETDEQAARYRDWPGWSFAPRYLALAEDHPEDPVAFEALARIIRFGDNVSELDRALLPIYERATAQLLRDHLDDNRLKGICKTMNGGFSPPREAFLRTALERSRDREVRAWACLALASGLESKRDAAIQPVGRGDSGRFYREVIKPRVDPAWLDQLRSADSGALLEESKRLYERVMGEFGDLPIDYGRIKSLGEFAKFSLNKLVNTSVGSRALEVEGPDAEGKAFRLSDYRGKVVMLTFSGNWCPPCRSMYPHERELVERLKGRPFALVSVNTDEDRETLRKSMRDGEITWRCWWESGTGGPICTRWSAGGFPTIFVIDREGVIRDKFVGPPHPPTLLDEAVESLLAEGAK